MLVVVDCERSDSASGVVRVLVVVELVVVVAVEVHWIDDVVEVGVQVGVLHVLGRVGQGVGARF